MVSVRCDSDQGRRNRAAGGSWLSPGAEKNGIVLGNLDPDSSLDHFGFVFAETLSESIWLSPDDASKEHQQYLYKLLISKGSTRSSILGEATINLSSYMSSKASLPIALPLKKCDYGRILQVAIQCLTPRPNSRWSDTNSHADSSDLDNMSEAPPNGFDTKPIGPSTSNSIRDTSSALGSRLGTVHLCRSVIRSIETARIFDFEEFPVRDKVTYMYYTGRLEVLNENFPSLLKFVKFGRIAVMILVWQFGEKSGYESWKGLSRSMRVVVVTHGGVIRALGQRAYTGTGQRAGRILNVSVNVFHLLEPDQWEIKSWGDVNHLNGAGYLESGIGGHRTSGDEKLQEMKEFEEEGEKLMKLHEEKMAEMKSSHWKEEIDLEEGCNTDLMDKYTPKDKVQG
ncbi:hypothetical protein L2E82_28562 [Cichorium intybus]|uniref:Uncharacterized protein n=1 Tax=Cichorium intybus TaxID=13427 RepID=A0ACB9CWI4_CICIN|nr:hypothetical protein L2E82_28562 [Cichorium intybus]